MRAALASTPTACRADSSSSGERPIRQRRGVITFSFLPAGGGDFFQGGGNAGEGIVIAGHCALFRQSCDAESCATLQRVDQSALLCRIIHPGATAAAVVFGEEFEFV